MTHTRNDSDGFARLQRFLRGTVPVMVMLLGSQGAWAACTAIPGVTGKVIDMDMGKVLMSDDLAINTVIATRTFAIPVTGAAERLWRCRNGGRLDQYIVKGAPVPGSTTIYSTNVPGVGIRLSVKYASAQAYGYYPGQTGIQGNVDAGVAAGAEFRVELIKTAAETGKGPLSSGDYSLIVGDGDVIQSMITTRLSGSGTTLLTPSCAVDAGSRNIPVDFGKVALSDFKGRGSTARDRNFNIRLNCQMKPNTVQIRMDATADPANVDGVLRITQAAAGTNTAGGVGIQILNGRTKTAVNFGDTVDVGPSVAAGYVLPYTARYYQTGNAVTPGQANGTATFTLDYR
ncbi:fimbrial protein [Variovorax sp. LT1R16]|uniref:fimbrial protein n=1 Tax=Variovorax sp. LT1R16 TaxID=3443728 RepID=UPI003F4818F4